MKILKKILLIVAIFIGLILVAAVFVKKDYSVERQIVINKSKQEVFSYIKLLKNQDNFNKWAMMDPKMRKSYTGTDGTVGFTSAWDSDDKNLGKGEQEIVEIIEGERVNYSLRFKEPFESTSPAYMTTDSVAVNQTKVKWGMSGTMTYPTNAVLLFFDISDILGRDLTTGLATLKGVLEK